MGSIKAKLKSGKYLNIDFSPGDIVIDCGANVGEISAPFAYAGAVVLAYEPNPYAFRELEDRFRHYKNVRCLNAAVSHRSGKGTLFYHELAEKDPLKYSTGSSLVAEKKNVNVENYIEVELIDLPSVIRNIPSIFGKSVHVLKIDIEGAECELVEKLMDLELLRDIPYVLVETHEEKIASLVQPTEKMKKRAGELGLTNINFNWI